MKLSPSTIAVVVAGVSVVLGPVAFARDLTFGERVKAQEAIERASHAHLQGPSMPFEQAWPRTRLEAAVMRSVHRSIALETRWQTPVTGEMLDAELARIERHSAFPERLREIFAALGNDPVLIKETLVRSALVGRMAERFFAADTSIPKDVADAGFDAWYADVGKAWPAHIATVAGDDPVDVSRLARSTAPCPADDTWDNGPLDDVPEDQGRQVTVWTGSEMIVYGGTDAMLRTTDFGRRYQPLTDTWTAMSREGHPGRLERSAGVWTGSLFVVWGGATYSYDPSTSQITDAGGRYDPAADSWSPITTTGAPQKRYGHTAVWSGTEMLVWGGRGTGGELNTGARYNPVSDTWTPMSTVNAPSPGAFHVAVWTGDKMFVWGGESSGGLYSPATDTWTPVNPAGAPPTNTGQAAAWTGTRVFIWGGVVPPGGYANYSNTGGLYDPVNNSWTATTLTGAPLRRTDAKAVWTGSRLLVWGGWLAGFPPDGGAYDPTSDVWTPMSQTFEPEGRTDHSAIWTGNLMLVWGGVHDAGIHTGGRYDPISDSWTPTSTSYVGHATGGPGNWNGVEVYWINYRTGADIYDPTTDTWRFVPWDPALGSSTNLDFEVANWADVAMLFWGETDHPERSGVIFDTRTDTWRTMTAQNAPWVNPGTSTSNSCYGSVWTGTELIFWCADPSQDTRTYGGRYVFATDTWAPHPDWNGPQGNFYSKAFWTGTEAIFLRFNSPTPGGAYDPITDSWRPISSTNAPQATYTYPALYWNGTRALVWFGTASDARRYELASDTWLLVSTINAPTSGAIDAFNGNVLALWGGTATDPQRLFEAGKRYDVMTDTWTAMSEVGNPGPRAGAQRTAVIGPVMTFTGGRTYANAPLYGGGRYVLNPDTDGDGAADSCDNCPSVANPSQTNADGDAYGDACDTCPVDSPNDVDGDGVCTSVDNCPALANPSQSNADGDAFGDACDNCPGVSNRFQLDGDADSTGDLCDNCPLVANADQVDSDADGSGNACDCQPLDPSDRQPADAKPLAIGKTAATANLSWPAVPGADVYSITRGDLAAKAPNQYGPCLAEGLASPSYDDATLPVPGQGFFYLVQAQSFECGLGSLGTTSTEQQRSNANPAACLGTTYVDVHATSQTKIFGTVSGSVANTHSSNNAYVSITEVLSSGVSTADKFSRLEERWALTVGAGSLKQLHVEGLRSSSTDGDDFQFGYSTDGGTSFTALSMASLPLADDNTDRVATLPGAVTGSVLIRVVDTDRTAGHQTLDTVTIDELWIRASP